MLPLLELIAPLLRRFAANKRAMSTACLVLVILAIVADVGRWGVLPLVALIALTVGLVPAERGWR